MKKVLALVILLAVGSAFSAGKCKKDEAVCRDEGYRAMRIVYFDLVLADCPSLETWRREEAVKIQKEAMKATFGSPEWNALVAQMKGIEARCPDLTKSPSFSK